MSATEDGKRARKAYLELYATGSGRSSEFQADLDAIEALTLGAKRWECFRRTLGGEMGQASQPSAAPKLLALAEMIEAKAL